MITASTYRAPNWVDLATPDIESATTFYRKLLGWGIETIAAPMGEYHIGHIEGQPVGGMMRGDEALGDLALWTTFVYVEDLDAAAARVESAGGRLLTGSSHTSFAISELLPGLAEGRVAAAADPTGAIFGLVAGPPREGVWFSRQPGAVSWVEVLSRDPAALQEFYRTVFGWTGATDDTQEWSYTTFQLDDQPVAGLMPMPDTVPAETPSHWSIHFTVDDCEAMVERLTRLGGTAVGPIMGIDTGRFVVVQAPQGAVSHLIEYSR